jgi:hypothetical protein
LVATANRSFEMRLESGRRAFLQAIAPADFGHLTALQVPDFCCAADYQDRFAEGIRGAWDLWPIDDQNRRNHLDDQRWFCRPLQITRGTAGAAIVLLRPKEESRPASLLVQLLLSPAEAAESGVSVLEDWLQIIGSNKDDLNKEVVLRLGFDDLSPEEIDNFKTGRQRVLSGLALVTKDITLTVGPRAIQWSRDD